MSWLDDVADRPEPPPDPLDAFDSFVSEVRARLAAGRDVYGDRSFSLDPAALLTEVQAELLDVTGWSYILYQRLEAIRAALAVPLRLVGAEREDFLCRRQDAAK